MLLNTLFSLKNQKTRFNFCVYLIENDAIHQEGFKVAEQFILEHQLSWKIIVEPNQGNVFAINAAFTRAFLDNPQTPAFLMIDDDEEALPDWLELMVQAQRTSACDIIGGPVHPRFTSETKAEAHPVYHPAFNESGEVPQIYGSGNCLISAKALGLLLPFDLSFNHLGGADSDFFNRAKLAGFKFFWCEEAKIYETVPRSRLTSQWLFARGMRIGALNVLIEQKKSSFINVFLKSLAIMPLSILRAVVILIKGGHYTLVLHPIMISIGRFLPMLNLLPKPYKA